MLTYCCLDTLTWDVSVAVQNNINCKTNSLKVCWRLRWYTD